MKNKIVKALKRLISLVMILSICIPCNAAQTVDGTAFLTKAEFDRALSSFDERLTAFEAGINSKIDTQVTTYLDRNGIWSAKDQVLVKKFYTLNMTDVMPLTVFTDAQGCGAEKDLSKSIVINNISKSGLAFINCYHGISNSGGTALTGYGSNTLARGFMYMTTTNSAYYAGSPDYKIYYAFSQYKKTDTSLSTKLTETARQVWVDKNVTMFGSYTSYSSSASCQLHLFALRGFTILNLFVTKGNDLYLTPNATWSAGSNIDEFTQITGHFANTSVEGKIGLQIDSIKVY